MGNSPGPLVVRHRYEVILEATVEFGPSRIKERDMDAGRVYSKIVA